MSSFLPSYLSVPLIIFLIVVVPFGGAKLLVNKWRMPNYYWRFAWTLFALLTGLTVLGDSALKNWENVKLGIDLRGGTILVYQIQEGSSTGGVTQEEDIQAGQTESFSMDELCSALKRRIDPTGVEEISVRPMGDRQVEITVPEVDEEGVASLKRKIRSVGSLEFRITANRSFPEHRRVIEEAMKSTENRVRVEDSTGGGETLGWWISVARGEGDKAKEREKDFLRPEYVTRQGKENGQDVLQVLVVNDTYDVQGKYLTDARAGLDGISPCVHFSFNSIGATLFGNLTGANLPTPNGQQKQLGIILDGHIYSAPNIQSQIFGNGVITGRFTQQEVNDLAAVLKSGRLPAVLGSLPASEMTTGPTLGQDTIERSTVAIICSFLIVIALLLLYYRFSGLVACIALFLNFILILAIMISINAAFTLPGLAGFVLTLGMAVDANILIFERMREENEHGGSLSSIIRNGFDKAFSAIIDSNITTLIVATILFWIGTEQIRGFAVMLWIGIVVSMFTAIYVSRGIFDVCEKFGILKEIKMRSIFPKTKIPFMKYTRVALGFSALMLILSIGAIFLRVERVGGATSLFDIDFTGGENVQVLFTEKMDEGAIRDALSEDLPDLAVTNVSLRDEVGTDAEFMRFSITTTTPEGMDSNKHIEVIEDLLKEKFGKKLKTNQMEFKVTGRAQIPATINSDEIPNLDDIMIPPVTETPVAETPVT
ncbi:MAG: protein translocase subunit SecD, partial [Planctomycetia bacterium]|nr:protein translocase subunit SecD [Planctomycetia bacterium]